MNDEDTRLSGYHPKYVQGEIFNLVRRCSERHNPHDCIWRTLEVVARMAGERSQEIERDKKPKLAKWWMDISKKLYVMVNQIYNMEWPEESSGEHIR